MLYSSGLTEYKRRNTRTVKIGEVELGGNHPIRLQSMTNTPTRDIEKTVSQCLAIISAGADLVRITAPGVKDAELLKDIRQTIRNEGFQTPIIADIHFSAKAGETAAGIVEKIRINPGNYVDKKRNAQINYSDDEYLQELANIKKRITPLIDICKINHTAIRIGVNHGSLSDRIMDRYGDTPEGMSESAMEFLRICRELNFHDVVVSMKASNSRVMVYANRLLVQKMNEEGFDYPLHLGVTEAGEGEDGRIKSAVGIGAMLADGIGETIRVSLTEAPEKELPVAKKIVEHISAFENHEKIPAIEKYPVDPFSYHRRKTNETQNIGGENVPVVISQITSENITDPLSLKVTGWLYQEETETWKFKDNAADYIFMENFPEKYLIPESKGVILPHKIWKNFRERKRSYPLYSVDEYLEVNDMSNEMHFLQISLPELSSSVLSKIRRDPSLIIVCRTNNANGVAEQRRLFVELMNQQLNVPVIITKHYTITNIESFQVSAACDTGPLFIDGLGDGLWLTNPAIATNVVNETAFGILQASRTRTTKTEYISCPGCGRTLFNLEETTAKIRKHTNHLKGLKIGIMGCIVNGPGEMADADYGYVGAGKDKITLYKNKDVIKKNIPEEQAIDELIALIKTHGDWKEQVME